MEKALSTMPVEQRAQQALVAMGAPTIEALIAKMETFKPVSEAEIIGKDTFTPAWESLKEVRAIRKDIETTGKNARADATAYGKAVIAAEKELVSVIGPVESILKEKTDAWKAAEEERKAEKRERLQRIEAAIGAITAIPGNFLNATASEIASAYEDLNSRDLEAEGTYGEFVEKAKEEKAKALEALKTAIDRASAQEEQARQFAEMKRQQEEAQAAIKAQQEEIARQQVELQRQQQEAAQAKLEAERAELAAKRQQQEEAERKIKEEQDRLAREAQAKADAEAKAQADKEEAERQAALAPDKDKLMKFSDDLREFAVQNRPSFTSDAAEELFCVAIVGRINSLADQIKERAGQL
jgi:DNA repair exonuclease SbcCD ATPase subunit